VTRHLWFRITAAGELDCARVVAHGVAGVEQCRLTDSTHSVCPPFRRYGRRTSARPFYCNTGLLQQQDGLLGGGSLTSVVRSILQPLASVCATTARWGETASNW
jgi:hypothetical protein